MSEPTITEHIKLTVFNRRHIGRIYASIDLEESLHQLNISRDLNQAEFYFSIILGDTAEQVRALMPNLVAEREIRSIEFFSHGKWVRSNGELGELYGVSLRGADNKVVLFVNGVSMDGSEPGELATFIFDTLGVSEEDREVIDRQTWPRIDYSVLIELL